MSGQVLKRKDYLQLCKSNLKYYSTSWIYQRQLGEKYFTFGWYRIHPLTELSTNTYLGDIGLDLFILPDQLQILFSYVTYTYSKTIP